MWTHVTCRPSTSTTIAFKLVFIDVFRKTLLHCSGAVLICVYRGPKKESEDVQSLLNAFTLVGRVIRV